MTCRSIPRSMLPQTNWDTHPIVGTNLYLDRPLGTEVGVRGSDRREPG